jgi:Uma2 family endonuclease
MSQARRRERWTWEAYLDWEARQPIRHELVDGEVHAMVGGTLAHDMICNNLRAALHATLRGGPCRPHGPDLKVKANSDGRYPDALIDCGPLVLDAQVAIEPVAVFEVLSPSTAWFDQTLKLRAYDATPTIRYYVLISQTEPRALIYTRAADGRLDTREAVLLEGMDAAIAIPEFDLTFPFVDLYEGIVFSPDTASTS